MSSKASRFQTTAATIAFIFSFAIGPTATATTSPELDFVEAQNIGVGAAAGFSHTYTNIGTIGGSQLDAKVTVVSVVNLDRDDNEQNGADLLIDELDEFSANANTNKELSAGIDVFGSNQLNTGYADFRIEFFLTGTMITFAVNNLVFHVKDIDSRQFLEVYDPTSYALTQDTELVVQRTADDALIPLNGVRFAEPDGASSSSSDEENWAEVRYASASVLNFRLGAKESGSANFGVSFRSAGFTSPIAIVQSTIIYDMPLERPVQKVAPSVARSLVAAPKGKCGISLKWAKPASPGTSAITKYEIFRNGLKVAEVPGTRNSYLDRCVLTNQSHVYQIVSVSPDGNSEKSRTSNAITRK